MAENSQISFQVLGALRLSRGSEALTLPQSKKTRALLAFLALNPKEYRRERLCDLFWEMPDDPRAALRWSLTKLRQLLNSTDRERIVANRETVKLDVSDMSVDLHAARAALADPDQLNVEALETLADDFSGALLDGLDLPRQPEYQAWLVAERGEAETLRVSLLEQLLSRLGDDPARAIPHARALASLEPQNDGRHAELVRLLKHAGRQQEAEDHVQVAKSLLADMGQKQAPALDEALQIPANARTASDSAAPSPKASTLTQDIRYCRAADGVNIAYSTVGSGPPLVKTANWLNHLEFEWKSPVWHHWIEEFSRDRTFIRYDERGNGLSDWDAEELSLDAFVSDLEVVVDAAGAERFEMLGISQGCAVAAAYAVRHPKRVSKLILYGGWSRGWRLRSPPHVIETIEASLLLMKAGWGRNNPAFRQMFTTLFFPDAGPEHMDWMNELERNTTSPETAYRLANALGSTDVSQILSKVTIPTLILHARHDAMVPFSAGKELAHGIPNAKFVPLDSNNHLLLEDEPAWARFVQEVRAFLSGGDG